MQIDYVIFSNENIFDNSRLRVVNRLAITQQRSPQSLAHRTISGPAYCSELAMVNFLNTHTSLQQSTRRGQDNDIPDIPIIDSHRKRSDQDSGPIIDPHRKQTS